MATITNSPRRAPAADAREAAAYPVAEAARYLRLPPATLRTWISDSTSAGGSSGRAVIRAAGSAPAMLSFWNLVEAHVLRALRTDYGVSLPDARQAIRYAEGELGISRLLLSPDLKTNAGRLFLDRYGQLTDLSASGQMAMRALLEQHLKRVEWDEWQFPVRLFPFVHSDLVDARSVVIDAGIAFGRPTVSNVRVSTSVIAARLDAGESVADVASDYSLTASDVEAAILYERAA